MLTGLLALVGVGLAVGLVLGGVALGATSVLGVGDEPADTASEEQGFFLPRPSPTRAPSGPLITLSGEPTPTSEGSEGAESPTGTPTDGAEEGGEITLSAGQTSVGVMQQIDLTGVYPGGEGAVLQVEKFSGGSWQDFPVTAVVSNETFATYVQTSFQGVNRFRVTDSETGVSSNEVKVTVG